MKLMCSIYFARDSRIIVVLHTICDFLHIFFISRLYYKCFLSFVKRVRLPKSRKFWKAYKSPLLLSYPLRLVLNKPIVISHRLQWFSLSKSCLRPTRNKWSCSVFRHKYRNNPGRTSQAENRSGKVLGGRDRV